MKLFLLLGSLLGFLGVALGAFGAHILKTRLSPEMFTIFQTGIKYHLFHASILLIVGLLAKIMGTSDWLQWSGWLFFAGIIIFSGSLYILSILGLTFLGAITPIGGMAFLLGWIFLFVHVLTSKQ
ncbi:MAG: DUF423 domain-containing protein [Calditrichaeota bacterium]|nr:MAG: DUF423 domain-containing protein [Calditrichota bacterium]